MIKDAALKLALEALEESQTNNDTMEFWDRKTKSITAIKKALAQPEEQQSCDKQGASLKMQDIVCPNCGDMARTWPKQERPWVGLTNKERDAIQAVTLDLHEIPKFFATAIEAKLKEKNT